MLQSTMRPCSLKTCPKTCAMWRMRSGSGLKLADVRVLCRDLVVLILAQLAHHRSTVVKGALRAMLGDPHISTGCADNWWFPQRRSRYMQKTRGSIECSEPWGRRE